MRNQDIFQVESIKASKIQGKQTYYLVKWIGELECTWEPEQNLKNCKDLIEDFDREKFKKINLKKDKQSKKKSCKQKYTNMSTYLDDLCKIVKKQNQNNISITKKNTKSQKSIYIEDQLSNCQSKQLISQNLQQFINTQKNEKIFLITDHQFEDNQLYFRVMDKSTRKELGYFTVQMCLEIYPQQLSLYLLEHIELENQLIILKFYLIKIFIYFVMLSSDPEQYLNSLKQEIRLHFFYPYEIQEDDNKPITIQTKNFLFYGYEVDSFQSTNHSDYDSEENKKSYIVYIGEYDSQFKYKGDGMMFFGIGAVLRGTFQKGFINGSSFLTLPNQKYLYMNFLQGNFVNEVYKINPNKNRMKKYKFVQGKFQEYTGQEYFDNNYFKKISNYLPANFIPDDIRDYNTSCYFGSFLMEDKSIYFGFIKEGKPQGWGIKVLYNLQGQNTTIFCTQELSWVFRNFDESESQGYIFKKTFENQVIYYYDKLEEYGVYNQNDNTFQVAKIIDNKRQILEKKYQGIPMQLKTYFENYFVKNKEQQIKSDRHISQMIFDIQNCQEILMFYLYGNLKKNVNEIYDDNLDIQDESPQKKNKEQDSQQSLPDTEFSLIQLNKHISQKTVQNEKTFNQPQDSNLYRIMKDAKRRQSSQSNQIKKQTQVHENNIDLKKEDQEKRFRQNFENIKLKISQMGTQTLGSPKKVFQIDDVIQEENITKEDQQHTTNSQNSSAIEIKKSKSVRIKQTKKKKNISKNKNIHKKQKVKKNAKLDKEKIALLQKIYQKMELVYSKDDLKNFCSTFKAINQFFKQQ